MARSTMNDQLGEYQLGKYQLENQQLGVPWSGCHDLATLTTVVRKAIGKRG